MKKITIIAALAALAFTACEKNEQTPVSGTSEVKFVIDEVVTRVTTTNNVTVFEEGDEIAITSSGLNEDIANEKYTYAASGLAGKVVSFKETGDASFVAHYPSSLTNDAGSIEMTVPAAQTADNFHKNMFMVATATGNAGNSTVNLQFAHQLAWVKIVLDGIEGTAVTLNNVKPTVTWTASSLAESGTATDITTWKQTDKQEYWALVPAQTISASTKLITVETASTAYEYTLASDLTLTTAKVKTVTLSLDPSTGLTQASFSVDTANDIAWADDTELEDYVTEKPYAPVVILSGTETITLPQEAATVYSTGEDGWNYVAETDNTFEVTQDNELKMIAVSSTGWTKNGAFYSLSESQIQGIKTSKSKVYKLTYQIKTTAQVRMVLYPDGGTGANNVDAILTYTNAEGSASSNARYIAANSEYVSYTCYLIFDQYPETMNIFFGGAAAEMYVKNITLEEYIAPTE